MDNQTEFKIRALPRSNNKTAASKSSRDTVLYIALGICVLALLSLHDFSPKVTSAKTSAKVKSGQMDLSSKDSNAARINQEVTHHLQDAEIKREMMMRSREVENEQFKSAVKEPNLDEIETLPDPKEYGVRFDNDESMDRVYEDTHPDSGRDLATLPADKINAHMANRKWMNEMERAEKIQFLSAFIRSAYEHGYEVEIDSNLVVVGVKRVQNHSLNINQVIDRLAKGQ